MIDMVESFSKQLVQADFDHRNLSQNVVEIRNQLVDGIKSVSHQLSQAQVDRQNFSQTSFGGLNEIKSLLTQAQLDQQRGAITDIQMRMVTKDSVSSYLHMGSVNSQLSSIQSTINCVARQTMDLTSRHNMI